MKWLRGMLRSGALVSVLLLTSSVNAAQVPDSPPLWLDESPLLITAQYVTNATPVYFEIYNEGREAQKLEDWTLSLRWENPDVQLSIKLFDPSAPGNENRVPYLPPDGYAVVGFNTSVTNALLPKSISPAPLGSELVEVRLEHGDFRPYVTDDKLSEDQPYRLRQGTSSYTSTYELNAALYQDSSLYEIPEGEFPLAPVEILANPRSCSPLETDTACHEYVKFYNDTTVPISFDGTRLRIGSQASADAVVLGGTVQSGEYAIFDKTESGMPLSITNSDGYVWLEDTYGLKTYQNTVTEYADASSSSHKGQSWALIDGTWQWAMPNPAGANIPLPIEEKPDNSSGLVPCRPDQFRNPATNRCKLIASMATSLKPCAMNQFRNPETNRCKLVSSSASSLKPCAVNQYRNPATNRCKLIASAASQLKPCKPGQVRNPETNRCRKATGDVLPAADFAVTKVPDDNAVSSPIGWLAFAGVGGLAVGYGVWEWRRELTGLFGGLGTFFSRK